MTLLRPWRTMDAWLLLLLHLGWNIKLELQAVNPVCEFVTYKCSGKQQGIFYTPKFPHFYPRNISCLRYTFVGEVHHIVEVTFLEFDLRMPVAGKCTDYLRLFLDLDSPEVNELSDRNYELCGNISSIPKQHYSSTNNLVMEFHSDGASGNNSGFRGIYKFIDKSQFQMEGGSLQWGSTCIYGFQSNKMKRGKFFSPRYPQNYPPNTVCQYIFTAMQHERVKIVFQNIQLETTNGSCFSSPDTIVVRDGNDLTSPVIAQYCNTLNGETVLSSAEHLHVELISDAQRQRQGFAAVFSFLPEDQRPDRSPGVGPPFFPQQTRKYTPVLHPGHPSGSVTHIPEDSPFFPSTTPEKKSSFNCDHEFISTERKNGTFASPQYPDPYPEEVTCRYIFQGQGRERVQIFFSDLDLSHPQGNVDDTIGCEDVDSVTVSVNVGETLREIGVYCGNQRPAMLMSPDGRMEVTFVSRAQSLKVRGFEATYRFVTDFGITHGEQDSTMVCGFIFKSNNTSNGTFTSPNFPGLYPRNTECHYIFHGSGNEGIYITFPYFDVEGIPPGCIEDTQSDYVEFSNFNVLLLDRKMSRFCGTKDDQAKKSVTSDGNFFRVTFKSNDVYDATGFEAFYQFRKNEDISATAKARSSSSTRTERSFLLINLILFVSKFFEILTTTRSIEQTHLNHVSNQT